MRWSYFPLWVLVTCDPNPHDTDLQPYTHDPILLALLNFVFDLSELFIINLIYYKHIHRNFYDCVYKIWEGDSFYLNNAVWIN